MSEKKTCCARVNVSWPYKGDPCGKSAKVERDGKWYCGTHGPVRVEERRKARREAGLARYEAERAAHRAKLASAAEQKRRADCYDDLLAALEGLVDYVFDDVTACNGLKCREPNCESCSGEEEARAVVQEAHAAEGRARAAIAKAKGSGQ